MSITVNRFLVLLPCSIAAGSFLAAGCKPAPEASAAPPQLSAEEQAKKHQTEGKAETGMRIEQINRSNLSPDQKQALINQVRSSKGK